MQVFSCEYYKIFKNIYFEEHLRMTASVNSRSAIFQKSFVLPFKLNALTSGISWQYTHSNLVGISSQFWQLRHSSELNLLCWVSGSRSSCPDIFCKEGVLRNFANFTGKHLSQSLFLNKIFLKKESLAQVFYSEFCKISKSTFFYRTPLVAASVVHLGHFHCCNLGELV